MEYDLTRYPFIASSKSSVNLITFTILTAYVFRQCLHRLVSLAAGKFVNAENCFHAVGSLAERVISVRTDLTLTRRMVCGAFSPAYFTVDSMRCRPRVYFCGNLGC